MDARNQASRSDRASAFSVNLGDEASVGGGSNAVDEFKFVDIAQGGALDVDGNIQADLTLPGEKSGYSRSTSSSTTAPGSGRAFQFLDKRGFGWLLEEELEPEVQKPLLEELDVDVADIFKKIRCVLLPLPVFRVNRDLLRDSPDFWGPLAVVLTYALVSLYGQLGVVSWILTIWLSGAGLVFMLARVLGAEVSYGQSLGVIGYSTLPLVITVACLPLLTSFHAASLLAKVFGIAWSTYSAATLLCAPDLQQKRVLLVYPLLLLFVYFFSLHSGV